MSIEPNAVLLVARQHEAIDTLVKIMRGDTMDKLDAAGALVKCLGVLCKLRPADASTIGREALAVLEAYLELWEKDAVTQARLVLAA